MAVRWVATLNRLRYADYATRHRSARSSDAERQLDWPARTGDERQPPRPPR